MKRAIRVALGSHAGRTARASSARATSIQPLPGPVVAAELPRPTRLEVFIASIARRQPFLGGISTQFGPDLIRVSGTLRKTTQMTRLLKRNARLEDMSLHHL